MPYHFWGGSRADPRPAAGLTEHCGQVFIRRARGGQKDNLPLPERERGAAASLGVAVLTGASCTHTDPSLFSPFLWLFFIFGRESEEIQTSSSCLWKGGPSYKGNRGLKREKREGAFPVPFLLQLCCLQKIIFHPSRETPKKKHNHLAEAWMLLPAALDVFLRTHIHAQIWCDSV